LRETGAKSKIPTFLIADKSESGRDVLRGARTIGLIAGTAAPETLIADVTKLHRLSRSH
jgi:4-hydroxy-3-methylbut-2-enyl diphosphate reductase IspH